MFCCNLIVNNYAISVGMDFDVAGNDDTGSSKYKILRNVRSEKSQMCEIHILEINIDIKSTTRSLKFY